MDDKPKYIQFPVNILPEIFSDKGKFFDNVLSIGAHLYSKEIQVDLINVAGQLIYHYITNEYTMLTPDLRRFIARVNGELVNGETFELFGDRIEMFDAKGNFELWGKDILLSELIRQDPHIMRLAISWDQHIKACTYFRIKVLNFEIIKEEIKHIDIEGQPLCMVKLDIVWDYFQNNKSADQLAQFAGYAAIRSILGKKDILLTNKNHIVARMFGASSIKTLPAKKHPLFEKYSNRYHIDKLLERLEIYWHLKTMNVPGLHGMYISFTKDYNELAEYAENRKLKNKRNELKNLKQSARAKAKQQLNKEPQLNKAI